MSHNLPQGTTIRVESLNGHQLIVIPHRKPGVINYFIGAFLVVWLGGWTMGFTSAANEILSGKGGAFLIFWLAGWSLGGLFAFYFIYRLFRKPVPERLLLNKPHLSIDSGIPPFKMSFSMTNQNDFWNVMFPKRRKIQISHAELKSLQLRETSSGNRLTIDQGAERIDLAPGSSEIEREWLYHYLQTNYS